MSDPVPTPIPAPAAAPTIVTPSGVIAAPAAPVAKPSLIGGIVTGIKNDLERTDAFLKKIPLVSYVRRYWLILVLLAGAGYLALDDKLFALIGTAIYAPALVLIAALTGLLIRHIVNADTADQCIHSGEYDTTWKTVLTAKERLGITVLIGIVYFLGACLIVAAVAK